MQLCPHAASIIPAALTFAAVVWWAGRGSDVAPEVSEATASSGCALRSRRLESPSAEDASTPASGIASAASESDDTAETSFQDYVGAKYRFLFTESGLSKRRARCSARRLLERERIAVAINTARQSSDLSAKEAIPQAAGGARCARSQGRHAAAPRRSRSVRRAQGFRHRAVPARRFRGRRQQRRAAQRRRQESHPVHQARVSAALPPGARRIAVHAWRSRARASASRRSPK